MKFFTCSMCNQVLVKLVDEDKPIQCCNNQMEELIQNSIDDEFDTHKPVIRKIGNFVTITVGEDHPMIDVHHISMIFIETTQGFQYKHLNNHQEAKAEFILANKEAIVNVYIHCNVHLLWSAY